MLALIKLQNGTELIGQIGNETNDTIELADPLQINYRLVATQPMPVVSVSRYMPFSGDTIFNFRKNDLLHVVEPRQAMVEYYSTAIENYRERIDKNVEQELLYAAGVDTDPSDDEITEAYRALLKQMPTPDTFN